jgi:hypothetical protein
MTDSMIYFILGCSGITIIVTISTLLEPFRNLFRKRSPFIYKLLTCPMCFGVYVGVGILALQGTVVYDYLMAAGTISLVSWIIVMKLK